MDGPVTKNRGPNNNRKGSRTALSLPKNFKERAELGLKQARHKVKGATIKGARGQNNEDGWGLKGGSDNRTKDFVPHLVLAFVCVDPKGGGRRVAST